MWCPKCQNEYREGIVICPECNTALVEELESDEELVAVTAVKDADIKDKICKYLDHVNIKNCWLEKEDEYFEDPEAVEEGENKDEASAPHTVFEISVPASKAAETVQVINAIIKVEMEKKLESDPEEAQKQAEAAREALRAARNTKGYTKASEKSSDYLASGQLFIGFGVVLIVFGLLILLQIITLFNNPFSIGIFMVLGLILVIYGVISTRRGSSLTEEIKAEENFEEKIRTYLDETITKDVLDSLNDETLTPELLYLKQNDYIKEQIMTAFPDINEEHADILTEEFMNKIYND